MEPFDVLKSALHAIIDEHGFGSEVVHVKVKVLTPEEAIGNPEHQDYPLIKGRERMMEADFRGSCGQAFTDMFGQFSGSLADVAGMDLENNYRRAIFLSALNAVTRHLGVVDKTMHCKDSDPPQCAKELASHIGEKFGQPRIALVGLQPRMAEALAQQFEVRVTDMDADNVGTTKFGIRIQGPEDTADNLAWCDVALVTGTTLTNETLREFVESKPAIFFGVTIAAAAHYLCLERFCPYGR
jgi:hypothetical protein